MVGWNRAGQIFHDAHDLRDVVGHAEHDEIAGGRHEVEGPEVPFFTLATTCFDDVAASGGKGAFGGGLAIIGVPVMALVIDPITAAIIFAPLVVFMDLFALRAFPPSTWSGQICPG